MSRYARKERRDIHADITGKIIAQLEAGTVPWLKPWKTIGGTFGGMPRNAITRRRYSGINVVLLWMAAEEKGYASAEWLTFRQAQAAGGHVRAGEKATQIIFMKPSVRTVAGENGEDELRQSLIARAYTVFNVEQCDGLDTSRRSDPKPTPLLDGLKTSPDDLCAAFNEAVKRTGVDLRYGGPQAYYRPSSDHVQMPEIGDFTTGANHDATLAHEMVHWTGAKKRLDRFDTVKAIFDGRKGYAFEELVAELGAAFTCAEFGITGDLRHASYIESWIKLLKEDKRAVMRAASKASRAVAYLYPESAEEIDSDEDLQEAA